MALEEKNPSIFDRLLDKSRRMNLLEGLPTDPKFSKPFKGLDGKWYSSLQASAEADNAFMIAKLESIKLIDYETSNPQKPFLEKKTKENITYFNHKSLDPVASFRKELFPEDFARVPKQSSQILDYVTANRSLELARQANELRLQASCAFLKGEAETLEAKAEKLERQRTKLILGMSEDTPFNY